MTKTKKHLREFQIETALGTKVRLDVLTYMRKNPREVYRNFKSGQPIFGPYSVPSRTLTKVENNIDTVMTNWKSLYSHGQLIKYGKYTASLN